MGCCHGSPNCRQCASRDDRGSAYACAKAVDESTCRGVGTSITARTPIACGRSGAGRRPSGKPSDAWMKRSKPSTPRPSGCAVSAPPLRRNPPKPPGVAPARGHAAKIFFPLCCATGRDAMNRSLNSHGRPASLLLPGLPSGGSPSPWIVNASGVCEALSKAVAPAQREYAAARKRRCATQHHSAARHAAAHRRLRDLMPPSAPVCRLLPWFACSLTWDEVFDLVPAPDSPGVWSMIQKHILVPKRLRRPPATGWSWVDRRFLREHGDHLSRDAILLYLFLAAVADRHGLSFYSDNTLSSRLRLPQPALAQAGEELLDRDLIAHQLPLVQVLSLPERRRPPPLPEPGQGLIAARRSVPPSGRSTPLPSPGGTRHEGRLVGRDPPPRRDRKTLRPDRSRGDCTARGTPWPQP